MIDILTDCALVKVVVFTHGNNIKSVHPVEVPIPNNEPMDVLFLKLKVIVTLGKRGNIKVYNPVELEYVTDMDVYPKLYALFVFVLISCVSKNNKYWIAEEGLYVSTGNVIELV